MVWIGLPLLYLAERSLSSAETRSPMPPSFTCPYASVVLSENTISPPSNIAPSETMTTEYWLGWRARSEDNNSVRCSMSNLYSGMTHRFAAPAIVGSIAVNPAYRPNTSITRNRSGDPADVRRRFDNSMVRLTQVLKPMQ